MFQVQKWASLQLPSQLRSRDPPGPSPPSRNPFLGPRLPDWSTRTESAQWRCKRRHFTPKPLAVVCHSTKSTTPVNVSDRPSWPPARPFPPEGTRDAGSAPKESSSPDPPPREPPPDPMTPGRRERADRAQAPAIGPTRRNRAPPVLKGEGQTQGPGPRTVGSLTSPGVTRRDTGLRPDGERLGDVR